MLLLEEQGVEGYWVGPNNSSMKSYIILSVNQNTTTFSLILNENMLIVKNLQYSVKCEVRD